MKIWAYLALAILLTGAVATAYSKAYNSGYDKRDLEISQDAIKQQNEAIAKGIADWVGTQEQAEVQIIIEEVIVERIREIEKRIPYAVEKIVEVAPECSDLGDDFAGMLNDQIRASNSNQIPDTKSTDTLAAAMP